MENEYATCSEQLTNMSNTKNKTCLPKAIVDDEKVTDTRNSQLELRQAKNAQIPAHLANAMKVSKCYLNVDALIATTGFIRTSIVDVY